MWVHRLSQIDGDRAVCMNCGPVFVYFKPGRGPRCRNILREEKRRLQRKRRRMGKRSLEGYRKHVGAQCNRCGFIPEDRCQLDVDHVDGNHKNNAPSNLQTLCANCHRLKTKCDRRGISLPDYPAP